MDQDASVVRPEYATWWCANIIFFWALYALRAVAFSEPQQKHNSENLRLRPSFILDVKSFGVSHPMTGSLQTIGV